MCSAIHTQLIKELQEGTIARIYKKTYESIISRVEEDGYFGESLTGIYSGEFCRTIGGLVSLLLETGDDEKAQKALTFVFESMKRNGLSKVPHTLGKVVKLKDGNWEQWVGKDDQIDGRAHVVMAYARYCLKAEQPEFENTYYNLVKNEMSLFLEQPYFYYQLDPNEWACTRLGLILNCSFEHSREGRRWSVFDLLSQSFVGAAAEAMIKLAMRRKDTAFAEFLQSRLDILKTSIDKYMTREVNGKKVYLEMRLPDGNWGKEFTGMGWVCYSPIPAQWEALDRQILRNTIDLLKQKLYINDPLDENIMLTFLEYDENGHINYSAIGKSIGWDIDYCRQEGQYDKILDWCGFFNKYHTDHDILMENINLTDGKWVKADCGNGEQCVWWCFAIARLRKALSLPVL